MHSGQNLVMTLPITCVEIQMVNMTSRGALLKVRTVVPRFAMLIVVVSIRVKSGNFGPMGFSAPPDSSKDFINIALDC